MLIAWVDESFCTVGARRDIDGARFELVVEPDRRNDDVELILTPKAARILARELNRWLRATRELA